MARLDVNSPSDKVKFFSMNRGTHLGGVRGTIAVRSRNRELGGVIKETQWSSHSSEICAKKVSVVQSVR